MSKVSKFSIVNQIDCKCSVCNSTTQLTLDHIYPKSKGGANHPANYQILCFDCNQQKGSIVDGELTFVDVVTTGHIFDRRYNKSVDLKTLCKLMWAFFGKTLNNLDLVTASDMKKLDGYLSMYGIVPTTKTKVVKVVADQSKKYIAKPNTSYTLSQTTIKKLVELIGA